MRELLPCPFCGAEPRDPQKSGGSDERCGYNFTVTIGCECGVEISVASHKDKNGWCNDKGEALQQAIAAWNRRTPPGEGGSA